MLKKYQSKLWVFLGLGICTILLASWIQLALHKRLWTDEGNEILSNCPQGWLSLAQGADTQCSPSPLYYFFLKLTVLPIHVFDQTILLSYRSVSLGAAFALGVVFFLYLGFRWGWASGLIGLLALAQQGLFHQYAAENRPYMLWLLVFFVHLCCFSDLWTTAQDRTRTLKSAGFVALSSLALTAIAGPGMLQVFCSAASVLLFALVFRQTHRFRSWWRFLAIVTLACLGIGVFYSLKSCKYENAGDFDLLYTRDINLVLGVIRLFLPKSVFRFPDTALVFNGFFLFGVWTALRRLLKRQEKLEAGGILAYLSLFQLGLAFPIAILIAVKHYYFLQRVFIFILIPWAILASYGARELLHLGWVQKFKVLPLLLLILSIPRVVTLEANARTPFYDIECDMIQDVQFTSIYLDRLPYPDVQANVLVDLDRAYRKCGYDPAKATKASLLIHFEPTLPQLYRLEKLSASSQPLPKWISLEQCGKQIRDIPQRY